MLCSLQDTITLAGLTQTYAFILLNSTPLPEVMIMRVTTWLSSPEPKTVQPN